MTRLFVRFYAMVALFHFLAVLAWFAVVLTTMTGDVEEHLVRSYHGPVVALAAEARQAPDVDAWATRRSAEWGWPIGVRTTTHVAPDDLGPDGFGMSLGAGTLFAAAPVDDHRWLEVGPLPFVPTNGPRRWLLLAVMASAGIGAAAWIGLRPIQNALAQLHATARRLGQGDLSARTGLSTGPGAELAGALDRLADRVERLLVLQRDTLQGVSHELRTPLTRVRFGLELVVEGEALEARERAAEDVSADLDLADNLLAELLSWLKLESTDGVLRTEAFAWGPLLADIAAEEGTRRADVVIAVEGVATGVADPRLARRAVRNLVANAVRAARTSVWVRVAIAGGRVSVTVEDDGPGLGSDRERWFRPFTRGADAREADPGGVGLGLTLVQRIAEAHGGTVEAGERDGGGARMVFSVPATDAS